MSYPLRSFPGAALAGTLQTAITNASTTFTSSTTLSSWSDITGNNWAGYVCVAMEYGTANEEKILCTYNPATQTFTIVNRNYDGTAKVNHAAGSLFVPVFTATEAGELNNVTQSLSGMLSKTGTSTTPGDTHLNSSSVGSSKFPAYADHYHSITDSTLNTWLGSTASATLPAAVHVPTTNLDAGALPGGVTVPTANISSGTLPAGVAVPTTNISSGALPSGVTLPGGQVTGTGVLALAALASGTLPSGIVTSGVWSDSASATPGAVIGPVTGYSKYIVLFFNVGTATTAATYPSAIINRSASNTMSSPTQVMTQTQYFPDNTNIYRVSGFSLYQPSGGASATFYLQSSATSFKAANLQLNYIVIGLN